MRCRAGERGSGGAGGRGGGGEGLQALAGGEGVLGTHKKCGKQHGNGEVAPAPFSSAHHTGAQPYTTPGKLAFLVDPQTTAPPTGSWATGHKNACYPSHHYGGAQGRSLGVELQCFSSFFIF